MRSIKRWAFLGLVVSLVVLSAPVEAPSTEPVRRIGILCGVACEGPGYELIETRPHLVIAYGPQATRAVKDATTTIPIVMIGVADPVRAGLVQSLARPGGNVTGLATLVPGGFLTKQFELLKSAVPNATRIAALVNPTNDMHRRLFPEEVPAAALKLGVQLQVLEVQTPSEIDGAIDAAVRGRADALLVVGDPLFNVPRERIPELAARARLPAMYLLRSQVEAGGLMSYGPNFVEMDRRAAWYVDKLLRDAKPADLPIEQPTKFELVINLRTAKALGLAAPPSVLQRADHIIE